MVKEDLIQWVQNRPPILTEKPPIVGHSPFSGLRTIESPIYLNHSRLGFVYQDVCAQLFKLSDTYQIEAEEIQLFEQKKPSAPSILLFETSKILSWSTGKLLLNFIYFMIQSGLAQM